MRRKELLRITGPGRQRRISRVVRATPMLMATPEPDPDQPVSKRRRVSAVRLMVTSLILLLLLGIFVGFWLGDLRNFEVISRSMAPTLEVGDRVIMAAAPENLDLHYLPIAFDDPKNPGEIVTKRVIGTRGDTVSLRDGRLYVNDVPEPRNRDLIENVPDRKWEIDGNKLFVVGDNRNASEDSIDTGPIDRSQVLGVLKWRYWPLSRAGRVR